MFFCSFFALLTKTYRSIFNTFFMKSIKVHTTPSTNLYLRELYRANPNIKNCYVVAENQTNGRGQMGANWISQEGKNLTFSILLEGLNLKIENQFKLSAITSLAILKVLKQLGITNLKVKWPNDILAESFKICGVLIENMYSNQKINASIIGIGLNVNQENFDKMYRASSLKQLTGIHYDLDYVLKKLVKQIEDDIYEFLPYSIEAILEKYHENLFRIGKASTFEFPNGERTTGIIKKVSKQGLLEILFEDHILKSFEIKEIKLLY